MTLSKKELLKELRNWDTTSLMELSQDITEIIKENSITVELILEYDQFKGSGKCCVKTIDPKTRKLLDEVTPDRVIPKGKYKGEQIYTLVDGYYFTCETGNKAEDHKKYIKVVSGEITIY